VHGISEISRGVYISTVRYAADLDYRLIVMEDCCADQDAEVHDFLMQRLLPRQAEVVTAAEVLQAFAPCDAAPETGVGDLA
jgi:isochorismate hydrolase